MSTELDLYEESQAPATQTDSGGLMQIAQVHDVVGLAPQFGRAGKIRAGEKVQLPGVDRKGNPKFRASALSKWRITTPYQDYLDQCATEYGGTVEAWHDDAASPPDQWELYTDTDTIDVIVPLASPLQVYYEKWHGSICEKRLDGRREVRTGEVLNDQLLSDDDAEVAAWCARHEVTPTARFHVMLPHVQTLDLWVVETRGVNAIKTVRGEWIKMQAAGMPLAEATLELRRASGTTVNNAGRRVGTSFVMPVLRAKLAFTPYQLLQQQRQAAVSALAGQIELEKHHTPKAIHAARPSVEFQQAEDTNTPLDRQVAGKELSRWLTSFAQIDHKEAASLIRERWTELGLPESGDVPLDAFYSARDAIAAALRARDTTVEAA